MSGVFALEPRVLAALAAPEAYPEDPSARAGVEHLQTHISHVFLTGERVYKFRKAVDLGFVRFATLAERSADCLREVALNRRLAPDVYLGVAPLVPGPDGPRVGALAEGLAPGETEHCVVMRRLPAGRDALTLLEKGELSGEALDRVAARIALFHRAHGLGAPAPFSPGQWRERCVAPAEENFRLLRQSEGDLVPAALLRRVCEAAGDFARDRSDRFERRRRDGRAVDGHGDLHLQHLWFERRDAEPLAIDCLEFDEGLRRIDAASDVAFLAMDLAYRNEARLAERFLCHYARESDDYDLYAVVDYFQSYRAAVRAKVAAIAARDPEIPAPQRARAADSARRHLELAARSLEPAPPGALVLVGGVVGTGKTSLALALGEELGAAVISSDRVRKSERGLPPETRLTSTWGEGVYAAEQKRQVYRELLARAGLVTASGRVALLDATYARRDERERARRWAAERGAPVWFVETRCPPELARERLARRQRAGGDASDAGPELYEASAAGFEGAGEWPGERGAVVETGDEGWRREIGGLAERIARSRSPT